MENKINIAELLKDSPKGMELDCTMYEDVCFDYVDELNIIHCYIQHEAHKTSITFNQHGTPNSDIKSKCVIFPKGETTWEGFQRPFIDGDIVTWEDRGSLVAFIYKERKDIALVKHHFALYTGSLGIVTDGEISLVENEIVFATEEEKQKLFDAIKAHGYKWNPDTKTLEKLPKFKVGNKIVNIHRKHLHCDGASGKISQITDDKYIFSDGSYISISNQDNWELVPNKFDITTLKPFDKVLVRDKNIQEWCISFFSHCNGLETYKHSCINGSGYAQCIPYNENTKHLTGTTNDCDDFYKTWE